MDLIIRMLISNSCLLFMCSCCLYTIYHQQIMKPHHNTLDLKLKNNFALANVNITHLFWMMIL